MPGRRLYTFLAERAASGDYTSQLGLISVIRKDFESLARLLKDQDEAGDTAGPEADSKKIGRIVLYIDDLDRCRSDQVVDVLQAVHLLLALDLFVVVVGVDPRWLLRSLQDRYRGTLDAGVTPSNYLEKIFNLPFVLPAFPDDGLGNLVRRLAASARAGTVTAGTPVPAIAADPGAGGPPRQDTAQDDAIPVEAGSVPVEAGSEIADARSAEPAAAPAPLTDRELAFLAALGPFVSTPRDAKRLFNLYRMLRATRDLSPASDFLGDDERPGEFQAVATLLAMLTADGDLLRQVLDAPRTDDPPVGGGLTWRPAEGVRWRDFARDLSPRPAGGTAGETWENQVIGQIPGPDVPAWQRLAGATTRTANLVVLADLSAFQRWAPRIRRFSYRLSRQAAG
jgi:KAP family P-loop domain